MQIKYSDVDISSVLPAGSRYLRQRLMYYGDRNILTFDTYNRSNYEMSGNERIMVITKGVEYRPDLVSYDVYGFTDNWWRIMEVNKIYDIFDFKAGRTIMLPEL